MVAQGINSQLFLFPCDLPVKSEKLQWGGVRAMSWINFMQIIPLFILSQLLVCFDWVNLFFLCVSPTRDRYQRSTRLWKMTERELESFSFCFLSRPKKRVFFLLLRYEIYCEKSYILLLFMFCYDSLLVKVVKTTPTIFNHLSFFFLFFHLHF